MRIRNDDMIIRNAEKDDCNQLAAWWNDGNVMAHAGFPLGLNTTAQEIQNQIAKDTDETKRTLIIEYRGQSIGEMNYYNMGHRVAEIGIKICDASFQEKGLGRIVLSMLIHELFIQGYTKIILDTNKNNTRAQHVYEKLGFCRVRIHENSWKNQLGELQSSIDYELTPDDFIDFSKER
ncbi:MAG: GNAT family N-acetyltransferase [Clostridia bacterium]|nr:GNAT family N-acetyltransferase [Clostridia bacterium]